MATTRINLEMLGNQETKAGNYFVSNYPPYSFWTPAGVPDALAALERPPLPDTRLGLYLHIPFCRKRCHFCYFRVYTDKNAAEIKRYLDAAIAELTEYAAKPFIGGRKPSFVYFGGGTPSYLSTQQLTYLTDNMKRLLPWDEAEEVTFECEPGTLNEHKLQCIKDIGVTRLSLGVEHFDESILRLNGRAHGAKEIDRAYNFAREVGFPQINIDLIAGMMGDTDELWRETIAKAVSMLPDSVTIYQMEIPYNTTIFAQMKEDGHEIAPVATWAKKREWVQYAFQELEKAGYSVTSGYTAVRDPKTTRFCYRDQLWAGADLLGLGVASFSHIGGVHFQNQHNIDPFVQKLTDNQSPIYRALTPTPQESLIRQLILQFKLGKVRLADFQERFGVDLREAFPDALATLREGGYLEETDTELRLNREGLLRVDRLVHEFFLPAHQDARYA